MPIGWQYLRHYANLRDLSPLGWLFRDWVSGAFQWNGDEFLKRQVWIRKQRTWTIQGRVESRTRVWWKWGFNNQCFNLPPPSCFIWEKSYCTPFWSCAVDFLSQHVSGGSSPHRGRIATARSTLHMSAERHQSLQSVPEVSGHSRVPDTLWQSAIN